LKLRRRRPETGTDRDLESVQSFDNPSDTYLPNDRTLSEINPAAKSFFSV